MIEFVVPGQPVPQGAIKTFIAGGRARGRHANASQLQDYRARIAMSVTPLVMWDGHLTEIEQLLDAPVKVTVTFYVARPKGHFGQGKNAGTVKASAPRFPVTRPDLSHLIRAFEDGLTGVLLRDDSLIVCVNASKEYDAKPRTEAAIEILTTRVETKTEVAT